MVGIKNNRRTIYTQKIIKESVLSLLETKSINKITVKDVCTKADVNRSTFYRYYEDIYACVDEIESEFIDALSIPEDCQPIQGLQIVLEGFYQNPILSNLAFVEGQTRLLQKMHEALDPGDEDKPMQFSEYQEIYVMAGMQGVLRKWVKDGMKEEPKELTKILQKLFFAEDLRKLLDQDPSLNK